MKTITIIGFYEITFADGATVATDRLQSDKESLEIVKRDAELTFNKSVTDIKCYECEPITYTY